MGGALVLRLAEDRRPRSPAWWWSTRRSRRKRLDVKLLPVLKHLVPSFPGIANDIKKQGVEEHGYTKTPLKAIHSMMQAWPTIVADLPKITAPLLYFRSTEDHVVDEASQPLITGGVSSRDVTVVPLENSYHVATLDNDAEQIFAESADFIARVTARLTSGFTPGAYARGVPEQPHDDEFDAEPPTSTPTTRGRRARLAGDRRQLRRPRRDRRAAAGAARRAAAARRSRTRRSAAASATPGRSTRTTRSPRTHVAEDDEEEGYVPPEPPPLPRLAPTAASPGPASSARPSCCWPALILSDLDPALAGLPAGRRLRRRLRLPGRQMPREPRDPWDDGAQI